MAKKTIFVAVHGIGDQVQNETIQAVARRVYAYGGVKAAPPALGAFHSEEPAYFPGTRTDALGELGFREVHWADVTRGPATEGYTLEEAKRWAKTIVDRLRARHEMLRGGKKSAPTINFELLERVLNEMIQTIEVSDRVLALARKANLGSFDLKRILDQFLGDVQFFTDFKAYRGDILARFNEVMQETHKKHPDADVVVVAHSEGSVVAFTALLLAAASDAAWLPRVEALVTLGSPIDKHIILWPEIFEGLCAPENLPIRKIQWWNYYDYGDPVGFELDTAREFLQDKGFDRLFEFDDSRDCGYTRYPFPGKAHLDYWDDSEVFGHFLDALTRPAAGAPGPAAAPKPRTRRLPQVTSYVVPYVAAFVVLSLAVYGLMKGAEQAEFVAKIEWYNLLGYTCLLAGVTLLARIPRLVRRWWRWPVGIAALAASAAAYETLVEPKFETRLDSFLSPLDPFVAIGLAVALLAILIAKWKPAWGMKPLVISGSVAAVALVLLGGDAAPVEAAANAAGEQADPSIWPLLVGGAFFLYLWWLAALLFDLIFVWHRNIRHSAANRTLREVFAR